MRCHFRPVRRTIFKKTRRQQGLARGVEKREHCWQKCKLVKKRYRLSIIRQIKSDDLTYNKGTIVDNTVIV